MSHELWIAFALLLVIEGIWPFLSPGSFRNMLANMAQQEDTLVRTLGFISMVVGVVLLYIVNG